MSDPAVEAVRRAWGDRDAAENELHRHQPILSMEDGSIAGCQCMDRVFYRGGEDWGSHLAEVCNGYMEAAAREALKPIRELIDELSPAEGGGEMSAPRTDYADGIDYVLARLKALVYSADELTGGEA